LHGPVEPRSQLLALPPRDQPVIDVDRERLTSEGTQLSGGDVLTFLERLELLAVMGALDQWQSSVT
jgi:hypothetical protein